MSVSTAVVSTRSLRPRVTFSDRASWTTRSLSALERLRADGVGPADQRGVVGDLLEVDAAELPEHQAVVDEVLGLLVAPAVEPHDHELVSRQPATHRMLHLTTASTTRFVRFSSRVPAPGMNNDLGMCAHRI